MEFDKVIFGNKTFSSLLEDIYKNSKNKEKQIRDMIIQLKDMINEPGDAIMMVPLLQGYMEAGIKNDEALIKMAGIAQRAATVNANSGQELINMDEISALLEEQKAVQEQGQKLLEQTPVIQINN